MQPGAWVELRCTCAHGPASGVPRQSGTPFAGPEHGKFAPDDGASARRSLFAAAWARTQYGTCSPTLNGIGFDKVQTILSSSFRWLYHQATLRRILCWNGQTSSSLTGRTSGLPKTELETPAHGPSLRFHCEVCHTNI